MNLNLNYLKLHTFQPISLIQKTFTASDFEDNIECHLSHYHYKVVGPLVVPGAFWHQNPSLGFPVHPPSQHLHSFTISVVMLNINLRLPDNSSQVIVTQQSAGVVGYNSHSGRFHLIVTQEVCHFFGIWIIEGSTRVVENISFGRPLQLSLNI